MPRRKNGGSGDGSGLPTAILYAGCFPLALPLVLCLTALGSVGASVIFLLGIAFLGAWVEVCGRLGLAAHVHSYGLRVLLGLALYLLIVTPFCVRLVRSRLRAPRSEIHPGEGGPGEKPT